MNIKIKTGAFCLLAIAGLGEPALAGPGDMVAQMDVNAPKYQTAECKAGRDKASYYEDHLAEHVVVGTAVAALLPFSGLLMATNVQEQLDEGAKIEKELIADCGNEAVLPYFQNLANDGDDNAQAWMGQAYAKGLNGGPDWAQAAYWYQKSAAQGNTPAEVNLGDMYLHGNGVPYDYAQAVKLWTDAAFQGSPEAQTDLGQLYLDGKEYDEARHLFEKAATAGHPTAQFYLASLYENGLGVGQDNLTAYSWYSISALEGYAPAAAKRDEVGAKLDSAQLSAASDRVRKCLSSKFSSCDL